mmetsp:Transcript_36319/g.78322  ORF Transcript_36319/g.78322 Transcript_36319/m.78322 type:complete len:121 (+) Transcript_36319:856-1218(+)
MKAREGGTRVSWMDEQQQQHFNMFVGRAHETSFVESAPAGQTCAASVAAACEAKCGTACVRARTESKAGALSESTWLHFPVHSCWRCSVWRCTREHLASRCSAHMATLPLLPNEWNENAG